MANRKRLPSNDVVNPLPRKYSRLAAATLAATPTLGGDGFSGPSSTGTDDDDSSGLSNTATTRPGDDDSSRPSNTATSRTDGDDSSGPQRATTRPGGDDSSSQKDSSQGKSLGGQALVQEAAKIVENKDRAELMVLELMRKYSFDFSLLRKLLGGT
jgi:hypothetical protein